MIFAQATDLIDAVEKFGVATVMLAFFMALGFYVVRRCFNEQNGLVVLYIKSTLDTMASISDTCQQNAETQSELAAVAKKTDQRLKEIENSTGRIEEQIQEPMKLILTEFDPGRTG